MRIIGGCFCEMGIRKLAAYKSFISKQPGDQKIQVLSEGLGNEDKVTLPKGTTAAASRFEPRTSRLRVCGLIH